MTDPVIFCDPFLTSSDMVSIVPVVLSDLEKVDENSSFLFSATRFRLQADLQSVVLSKISAHKESLRGVTSIKRSVKNRRHALPLRLKGNFPETLQPNEASESITDRG